MGAPPPNPPLIMFTCWMLTQTLEGNSFPSLSYTASAFSSSVALVCRLNLSASSLIGWPALASCIHEAPLSTSAPVYNEIFNKFTNPVKATIFFDACLSNFFIFAFTFTVWMGFRCRDINRPPPFLRAPMDHFNCCEWDPLLINVDFLAIKLFWKS